MVQKIKPLLGKYGKIYRLFNLFRTDQRGRIFLSNFTFREALQYYRLVLDILCMTYYATSLTMCEASFGSEIGEDCHSHNNL